MATNKSFSSKLRHSTSREKMRNSEGPSVVTSVVFTSKEPGNSTMERLAKIV